MTDGRLRIGYILGDPGSSGFIPDNREVDFICPQTTENKRRRKYKKSIKGKGS
jgi:hypothetical protein